MTKHTDLVYIDIHDGNEFICQIPYMMSEETDNDKMMEYIYSNRPTLRYRHFSIDFSNTRICE